MVEVDTFDRQLNRHAEMVEMGVAEPDRATATSECEYYGSLENEPYLILYNPCFLGAKVEWL